MLLEQLKRLEISRDCQMVSCLFAEMPVFVRLIKRGVFGDYD